MYTVKILVYFKLTEMDFLLQVLQSLDHTRQKIPVIVHDEDEKL